MGAVFTPNQERVLDEAIIWLNNYAKKNNIKNFYTPATESIHKSLRRLWLKLDKDIKVYPLIEIEGFFYYAFNLATFKLDPEVKIEEGLFGTPNKVECNQRPECKLIKEFPEISLYIFSIKDKNIEFKELRKIKYLTASPSAQMTIESNEKLLATVKLIDEGIQNHSKELCLQAISALRQFIKENPNEFLYYYYLGRAYETIMDEYRFVKKYDKAREYKKKSIEALKKSVELNGGFAEGRSYLGVLYARRTGQERLGELILNLIRANRETHHAVFMLDPLNPIVLTNRGIIYFGTPKILGGSRRMAIKYFKKAIKIAPNYRDAYLWLSYAISNK